MKLVVGLGNPGNQYNFTRHNSGFLALDFYFKRKNLTWEASPKFGAEWLKVPAGAFGPRKSATAPSKTSLGPANSSQKAASQASQTGQPTRFPREDIIFIKPQSFYNLSGQPVCTFKDYFKIATDDLLVICDDFNLAFGQLRYRQNGSAGGNNGLKSIIAELKTEDFPRLRLGTNNPDLRGQIGDIDFVLGKFTETERATLPNFLHAVETRLDELL